MSVSGIYRIDNIPDDKYQGCKIFLVKIKERVYNVFVYDELNKSNDYGEFEGDFFTVLGIARSIVDMNRIILP